MPGCVDALVPILKVSALVCQQSVTDEQSGICLERACQASVNLVSFGCSPLLEKLFSLFSLQSDDIIGSFPVFLYTWPEVCVFCPKGALWLR
jgi:hypothetical protein